MKRKKTDEKADSVGSRTEGRHETAVLLKALDEQAWEWIVDQLIIWSQHIAWQYRWQTKAGTLAEGKQPEDIAMDAIEAVLNGRRSISLDTVTPEELRLSLLRSLKDIVKSKLSHLVRSADHTKRVPPSPDDETDPLSTAEFKGADPHSESIENELRESVRNRIRGNAIHEVILDRLIEGWRPREIAEQLGIESKIIYGLIRTIRRHLRSDYGRE